MNTVTIVISAITAFVIAAGGSLGGVTASAGTTTTLVITNTWANDTDPREFFIRFYNDGGLTQAVTNKFWIDKWQIDSL